jgi:RimJ/RimL family protein N-acetyltransferase
MLLGNKVKLVPVTDRNLRELYDMWKDPDYGGESVGFAPMSWNEFETKFAKGATWFLIEKIERKEGVQIGNGIGWISYFRTRTDYPHLWEIGYALRPTERRKGYMTEAVKLIVEYLFRTKDIERIEAITDADNLASQGVLEKVGFKREGTLRKRALIKGEYRDDLIYGILREEWITNVETAERQIK